MLTRAALRRTAAVALAAGLLSPVAGALLTAVAGDERGAGTIGVRLLDAPADRQDDPRARMYIVDHVHPRTSLVRHLEVSNSTASPQRIRLYAGPATIASGSFVGAAAGEVSDLTDWTSFDATRITVPAGGSRAVTVSINVPEDASVGSGTASCGPPSRRPATATSPW